MTKNLKKVCECCGLGHIRVPEKARTNEMGSFWECQCGSTMFVMADSVAEELKNFKAQKLSQRAA